MRDFAFGNVEEVRAAAVHGKDVVDVELLGFGHDASEVAGGRRGKVEAADERVDLVDPRDLAGAADGALSAFSAPPNCLDLGALLFEGGAWNEILRVRLTELESRRTQIDAELATAVVPAPVTLHPNAAGLYAARVGELEAALNDPDLIVEATRTIRSLVQQIRADA